VEGRGWDGGAPGLGGVLVASVFKISFFDDYFDLDLVEMFPELEGIDGSRGSFHSVVEYDTSCAFQPYGLLEP
jgi:hypothetical protein